MRRSILAVALLCLASPATAQKAAPPAELPGFELKTSDDGRAWWHREMDGWHYFARPSSDVWKHSPLSIVSNDKLAPRGYMTNGVDLRSWASAPVPGFTIGGPASVADDTPQAFEEAPADDTAAPEPEATESDPIALFCRRYHLSPQTVYAALGGGGGILGVLLALALRRLVAR